MTFSPDTLQIMLDDATGLEEGIHQENESAIILFGEDCVLHIRALVAEYQELTGVRPKGNVPDDPIRPRNLPSRMPTL